MGFVKPWVRREFEFPPGFEAKAYKKLGNAVVIPQVGWLAGEIAKAAVRVFERRMRRRYGMRRASDSGV